MADILIIEDDSDLRISLKRLFEMDGHNVLDADNGNKGIQIYSGRSIDLVITDIFMPEKDGLETIRELKKKSPSIKIIAISGGGGRGVVRYLDYAKTFGVDYAFEKPVDSDELLDAVNRLLDI